LYKQVVTICAMLVFLGGCSGKTDRELCFEGKLALDAGNAGGAIVLLKNALEKNQNNLAARQLLADAYRAAGKFEQAEKEFLKVETQNPANSDVKLCLARLYNQMRKPDAAIRKAEEYLAARPGSADALEAIGIAHAISNMAAAAETSFLEALKSDPGRISTRLELAALYRGQAKTEQARALLNEVLTTDPANSRALFILAGMELAAGNKKRALEIYAKHAEHHQADAEAPYRAALIHLDQGDIANATKTANELVERFPKHAEGYRLKGIISLRQGNLSESITSLQKSLKIQPTVSGYYFLGLGLYNHGELENALSQFRTILNKVPSFHQARLLAGMILLRQNRVDDATAEISKVVNDDQRNAVARNLLGSAYMAKGMYEEGLRELELATRLEPRLIDAYLKKGILYLSRGDSEHVETELRTAVKVAPEILSTRLILSSYYQQNKNQGKALAVLKEGLTGRRSDAALYSGMAKIMFAAQKAPLGLNYLEKAKASDPSSVAPYFSAAAYYSGTGDYDKSIREYSAIIGKEPANIKAMLRIAALQELSGRDVEAMNWYLKAKQTRDISAYVALANRFARNKEASKALATLDEAIKYNPRTAEILELKGRIHLKERQFKEALRQSDDLEALVPERGIHLKVDIYLAMNRHEEALKESRRAANLKSDSPTGHMLLATVYRKQNNVAGAIDELKKAVRICDKNPSAALLLAETYAAAGNTAQAITTCGDIIRKRPDYAPAYLAQGTYLQLDGKPKEAIAKYQAALSLAENSVPALNNLAYLYAEGNGSAEDAVRLALTALAIEPGNPALLDTLGYSYLKCGKVQEARRTLERAAILFPDNPTINYHLALACKGSGDKAKAVAHLRQALRSGDFSEARDARSLLSEMN
jgi:putative PEP-CTERM system TPR-repeat lipoprotein